MHRRPVVVAFRGRRDHGPAQQTCTIQDAINRYAGSGLLCAEARREWDWGPGPQRTSSEHGPWKSAHAPSPVLGAVRIAVEERCSAAASESVSVMSSVASLHARLRAATLRHDTVRTADVMFLSFVSSPVAHDMI